MHDVRGAYFWQFGSTASLPTETTDGLLAFLAQIWPQKQSQSAKFKKIFLGGHAHRPPTLFTLAHTQWPYQSEISLVPRPFLYGRGERGERRKGLVNNSTPTRIHGCIPAVSVDEGKRECQVGVSRE